MVDGKYSGNGNSYSTIGPHILEKESGVNIIITNTLYNTDSLHMTRLTVMLGTKSH